MEHKQKINIAFLLLLFYPLFFVCVYIISGISVNIRMSLGLTTIVILAPYFHNAYEWLNWCVFVC